VKQDYIPNEILNEIKNLDKYDFCDILFGISDHLNESSEYATISERKGNPKLVFSVCSQIIRAAAKEFTKYRDAGGQP
jgi:hypothetical protein